MSARPVDLEASGGRSFFEVVHPADGRVLAAALGVGLLADLAVRSGVAGLAGALVVTIVALVLLASGRVVNRQAVLLVATATVFGAWLAVRASAWLLPLDVLAAGGLLAVGVSLARGGSVLDLSIPGFIVRAVHAVGHGLAAPAFALYRFRRRPAGAVARGALLALPLLVVLGILLASADAVFASLFRFDLGVDDVLAHVAVVIAGTWAMAALLRVASAAPPENPAEARRPLGLVEAAIVLGSLIALFGTFAIAQLVALSEGGRHVIETAGLTYAEYARTGFLQLLAAAAITVGALLALRAATDLDDGRTRRMFTVLAEVAIALTLVIVFVALRRLDLYEDVFGLTMLRLYSQVAAVWIGVVLVLLGLWIAGVGRPRAWLAPAAIAAGLVALLGLNIANPEAVVVRHNVELQADGGRRFDTEYLGDLSEDAVPALVDALPRLDRGARDDVLDHLCLNRDDEFGGWAAFNLARDRASSTIDGYCVRKVRS